MRIFLTFLLLANGAFAQENFWVGEWRLPSGQCGNVQSDGGSIEISADGFLGLESECSLNNPTAIRDMDGMLFDMACMAEGNLENYRILLLKESENRLAIYSRGVTRIYESCAGN